MSKTTKETKKSAKPRKRTRPLSKEAASHKLDEAVLLMKTRMKQMLIHCHADGPAHAAISGLLYASCDDDKAIRRKAGELSRALREWDADVDKMEAAKEATTLAAERLLLAL